MRNITFNLKLWVALIAIQFFSQGVRSQVGDLIWEDQFNTLNSNIWNADVGNGCEIGLCGWGNEELEYYREENLSIESIPGESGNNALVMEAKRESFGGFEFTSGKVTSEGNLSVHYGMIEIRMQTPSVETGLWPAAWLLGTANLSWPSKGEIDMMEMGHRAEEITNQGHEGTNQDNYVGANAIFANEDGSVGSIAYDVNYNKPYVAATSMANRYMTYRLYWEPSELRLVVVDNGVEYDLYEGPLPLNADSVTSAFQKPFFFLMNLAVGGNFTDAATTNQVTAPLPSKLYIDYVKVFEWNGYGSVEFDYAELVPETGPFGVYTEETPVNDSLSFGLDSEIYVWGETMQAGTTAPYEGNEVVAWETLNANAWFGGGIASTFGRDMSGYVEDGVLRFNIKIPADVSFRVGLTDNFTNEKWIVFNKNETQYGLTRDGEWGQVEIPLIDFTGTLAFQNINYMFAISSLDGDFPTSTFQFAVDNIVWDDGNGLSTSIDVSEVAVSPSNSTLLVGETVELNASVSPSNATNKNVTWASSNTSVASVNSEGLVTALSEGNATITVTTEDGDFTDATAITVEEEDIVTNPSDENLALDGVASQSTTGFGGVASRAIDDNTSGIWTEGSITHTGTGIGEWWQVTLDATYVIGDINLWNRTNCCSQRLDDVTVSVRDINGNEVWSERVTSSSATTLNLNADNVSGNVIRVTQNQNEPLSLAEVQVYEGEGDVELPTPDAIFPDLTKEYYINSPVHNLRLAATGESEDAYTTAANATGDDVAWVFVEKGNGFWHIQRAEGGSLPRLRTDGSANADMQATTSTGTFTYFELTTGATEGTYFVTLPNGPANSRLQVNNLGEVKMVTRASAGTWESFTFTEVTEDTAPIATNLFIEAEDFAAMNGVQLENTSDVDGGQNVGFIDAGDWMEYEVTIPATGSYTFDARIASVPGNGILQIEADDNVVGTISIDATGGWQNWTTLTTDVNLTAGTQTIRINAVNGGWNINWLEISNESSAKEEASKTDLIKEVTIYPNPATSQVNINLSNYNEAVAVDVIDMSGKLVVRGKSIETGTTVTIDTNNLSSGLYLVRIKSENEGIQAVKKLTIE